MVVYRLMLLVDKGQSVLRLLRVRGPRQLLQHALQYWFPLNILEIYTDLSAYIWSSVIVNLDIIIMNKLLCYI